MGRSETLVRDIVLYLVARSPQPRRIYFLLSFFVWGIVQGTEPPFRFDAEFRSARWSSGRCSSWNTAKHNAISL